MTTFTETFTGHEDRERVLTDILSQAPAAPGTTLVAHVDRATLEVIGVRVLPTAQPDLGRDDFSDEYVHWLSRELCEVAQSLVPERTWTGTGWSPITGELVTVVCREGEPVVAPTEIQYGWGWRYSNHHTAAFDSDVYAVTPQGWVALLGDWSGATPALPASPRLRLVPELQEAEAILADASSAILDPLPRECLLCYVGRMVDEFGCDGSLRFATHYRAVRAPRATALETRLGRKGGYCDCEIFLNGYDLHPRYWTPEVVTEQGEVFEATWPDPMPACAGVRAGSTQPCTLWWERVGW